MIFLQILGVLTIVAILSLLTIFLYKTLKELRLAFKLLNQPHIDELVAILKEEVEEKRRKERDEALAEYAELNKQRKPTPALHVTNHPEKIHTKNPAGKNILIPENLTEEEKAILIEFFDL